MIRTQIYNLILKSKNKYYGFQYKKIKKIMENNELNRFRNESLKKITSHAYDNCPYYSKILENIDLRTNNDYFYDNFQRIPILTKKKLTQEKLLSKDASKRRIYNNYSGGSTGEPTNFIQDEHYGKWFKATSKYYYKHFLGIDEVAAKKIIFWGSPRDVFKGNVGLNAKISNFLLNQKFLNSFRMNLDDMEKYVKIINSYKPTLIRGYASSLYEISKYIEKKRHYIYSPKIIVSSAETLNDTMREKIESVFGTRIHDFYGSRETASIAGECSEGLMHLFEFNNFVEIINNKNFPVKEGEMGKVIVTNLHNYSMPFIRYEIGDNAILGPKQCKCGSKLPTIKKIIGRIEEQFIKEDGSVVIGYFFVHLLGVVKNKELINKFQVIQEDYKKIKILIVPKGIFSDSEKRNIERKIKIVMGNDCKITWETVNDIPKTKSGKYLYTKSLVS